MDKKSISDYYNQDVPSYAAYDNLRKICSGIDGLKLSQRKIVWAAFKRCYNEWIKTDTMCAQTQIDTNYIHGAVNLQTVIDGMAASYVGSNNYPLLTGNSGGFGCRISPRASAGRYTRVKLSDISKILFNSIDNEILEKQYFEGQYVEPKFLVPIIPIMLLNGSDGMSTGFSHTIYSRNPSEVIEYIKKKISGIENPREDLLPWFRGHFGRVVSNSEEQRNESYGVIKRNHTTSYTISEIPIGIEYQKYVEFLDKLCDDGTIVDYEDKCDPKTDKILFEIKTTRAFTNAHQSEESLYKVFKLVKSLPETFYCVDENNRVKEYSNIREILDSFIVIRLSFYDKRKAYLLKTLRSELEILASKYLFCKGIVDKTIVVANKKKEEIVAQLEKLEKIIKIDGSYNFLLNMPIHSITKEKMEELKEQIKQKKDEYLKIKNTEIKDMWIEDLKKVEKALNSTAQ